MRYGDGNTPEGLAVPSVVVADHFDPWDLDRLAPILRANLGLAEYDAKHLARRARGIVLDGVTREQATAVASALAGVDVVDQRLAPKLGKPRHVQRFEINATSLDVQFGYGERDEDVVPIPWSRVRLVSAGIVRVVETRTEFHADSALADEFGPSSRTTTVKEEIDEVRADLFAVGAPGEDDHRLRLIASRLNYVEVLGEDALFDPERNSAETTCDNFRVVLARICRLATTADLPQRTVDLIRCDRLAPKPPDALRYEDEREFDAFNRWRLVRRLLDGPPAER